MNALLELRRIGHEYGAVKVLDAVSLQIERGARHAVIGPNGAGKSTLFSIVAGGIRPASGNVIFDGRAITTVPAHRRVRLGIAQTFQRSSLFLSAPVIDNVVLAVDRVLGTASRLVPTSRREADGRAQDVLEHVGLAERRDVLAGHLSHGEQRVLEIAMALACEPRLLLLDEPTAGASPSETARLVELLLDVPRDLTVMLVEHDFEVVRQLASNVTVLQAGRVLMTGKPDEVRADPAVQAAFFGGPAADDLRPLSRELFNGTT